MQQCLICLQSSEACSDMILHWLIMLNANTNNLLYLDMSKYSLSCDSSTPNIDAVWYIKL